jgi:hypothetical protein
MVSLFNDVSRSKSTRKKRGGPLTTRVGKMLRMLSLTESVKDWIKEVSKETKKHVVFSLPNTCKVVSKLVFTESKEDIVNSRWGESIHVKPGNRNGPFSCSFCQVVSPSMSLLSMPYLTSPYLLVCEECEKHIQ